MADRVSATITIGGALARELPPDFAAIVADEGLSTEWDGEEFTVSQFPNEAPLMLMAHEVAWGRFEELETFCVEHHLPFARWSGGYPGEWSPERVVFIGAGAPVSYVCDGEDRVVIDRSTVERLGSLDAIRAYFDGADLAVPPLRVLD